MDSIALANIEVAEKALNCVLPARLREFITEAPEGKVEIGYDTYIFFIGLNQVEPAEENKMAGFSNQLREQWKMPLVAIAQNYTGKALVIIPDENDEQLYMLDLTTNIIKFFSTDIYAAYNGEFFNSDSETYFSYKLNKDGEVERGQEIWEWKPAEGATEQFYLDEYDEMKSKVDDMIDDEETGKHQEILDQLYILTQQKDYAGWAWYKLSDIFFKGFGPIAVDLPRALSYNWNAILKGHSKSMANRAYCYLKGIGVEKNVEQAYTLIQEANARTLRGSDKPRDGLYYDMVLTIKGEYLKQHKKKK